MILKNAVTDKSGSLLEHLHLVVTDCICADLRRSFLTDLLMK